jgi:EAL domain-containing protein (putative c-di-GMP-specific phosphodiesterase class I)
MTERDRENAGKTTEKQESHRPAGENMDATPATLLLAALDADAEYALDLALKKGGFEAERCGPALMLTLARSQMRTLHALLTRYLPTALFPRVKGVFAGEWQTPEGRMRALLEAEALPVFFEQAEYAWARDALRDGWLFSVFQPILDARNGSPFAYEGLIRARHPETGEIVGAGQLFYACQRLHLQHRLDQQARITAIRAAAALPDNGSCLFVNVLPGAIYDPERCLGSAFGAASERGFGPSRLVFELTDPGEAEDPDHLASVLQYVRERGGRIALGDISGRFSALRYLSVLRPDYVKVTPDLVASAVDGPSARYALSSIVDMARRIDVQVVAQGIETHEQMQVCLAAGVHFLQGFLFATPANPPHSASAELLQAWPKAA